MCCSRCAELRVDVAHRLDHLLHDVNECGCGAAEQPRMAHSPAKNPAQHITAPFIRRKHSVSEKKRDGSGVIGDHAKRGRVDVDAISLHRSRALLVGAVRAAKVEPVQVVRVAAVIWTPR